LLKSLFCLLLLTGSALSASVVISSPANGSTVTSPIELSAKISGTLPSSVAVYADNTLLLSPGAVSSVSDSLSLGPGPHTLQVSATYKNRRRSSVTSVLSTFTVSSAAVPPPPISSSLPAQLYDDVIGINEANPQGVPLSWDWAVGPVMGLGNLPPSGWTASTAWGVVYQASQGNKSTNTRVNLRNMQLWFLSKSKGTWALLQNTSQPDGAAYKEDFSGDTDTNGDVRTEPDGTISVTSGMGAWSGDNFHFYPSVRGTINPSDVAGVVSLFEARLIVGNTSMPDDRSAANYIAEAGADYWPSVNGALPASYGGVTPPVGNGKFKYVQSNWRSFAMTTTTLAQLTANPPPVDLTGILP
jgi:hypothetical protein